MSIRKELAKLITGKAPEPQTRVKGGGDDNNPFERGSFGKIGNRRKNIEKWRSWYRQGGPIADAIDSYPLYALSNGWQLSCEEGNEGLRDRVQAWLDEPHVDFDSIMWQGILDSLLCGTAFQEIIPYERIKGIWGVVTRDSSEFKIKYDTKGRISGYAQVLIEDGVEKDYPVDIDRMLTLTLFPVPGEMYGVSLIERAEHDILRDLDVIESVTKAIHRHGTPKQQWDIGTVENPANDADFDRVEKEIETINAKTDFVTSNTRINMLDTAGVQNADVYSNVSLQRLACALGVPEENLGLGRGSTEATANVRMKAFLKKISTIQAIVARTYNRNVIDRITGIPGAVWIEFNDVDPEDEAKIAEWMAKLRGGVNPDAIVYPEYAQERLGIPPNPNEQDQSLEDEEEVPPEEQE